MASPYRSIASSNRPVPTRFSASEVCCSAEVPEQPNAARTSNSIAPIKAQTPGVPAGDQPPILRRANYPVRFPVQLPDGVNQNGNSYANCPNLEHS